MAEELSLWQRVLFVDWYGVLNDDVFWSSILASPTHPFHERLSMACHWLFQKQGDLVNAWMRGQVDSREIITEIEVRLDRRCLPDYLYRRLREDCRRMRMNPTLLEALKQARRSSFVVLATDNMDCFANECHAIPSLDESFDEVLCSSTLGVLKSEDPEKFFGSWLEQHHLTFSQATLLDDSKLACEAFEKQGGQAILVRSPEEALEKMKG
jgi:FMN phosphatase YigB (HAD superfamily)